jgi:hypothetical protein
MRCLIFIKNLGKGKEGMNKVEKIIETLKKGIDNLSDFIQIETRSSFEIMELDEKNQSYIIKEISDDICELVADEELKVKYQENKIFKVKNAKFTAFIPVDGKEGLMSATAVERIKGKKPKRCDCIFFDEYDFCFVEFKFNITGSRNVSNRKINGIEQLKSTIDKFIDTLNENHKDLYLEAYLCIPNKFKVIKETATLQQKKVEFGDKYEVELFETNEKICQ